MPHRLMPHRLMPHRFLLHCGTTAHPATPTTNLTQQMLRTTSDTIPHYPQGHSRGQKRRAASPPDLGSGGRSNEGFQNRGFDRRRSSHHSRRHSSFQTSDFRAGAGENPDLSACAICLSRTPHNVRLCRAKKRWDGKQTLYTRNEEARIVDNQGNIICSDWQRPRGCSSTRHRHECSGCGSSDHGAQNCPHAQPRDLHPPPT